VSKTGDFYRIHSIFTGSGFHPASYWVLAAASLQGAEAAETWNYSFTSTQKEVKNLGTYNCSPVLWLHALNPGINVSLPSVFTRYFYLHNRIGHIWHRNCLLKHAIEGEIDVRMEVAGRRGRRCKQLLDDLKGSRGYCKLKRYKLDRGMKGTRFGKVYGPVVRLLNEFNDWSAARMLGELWLGSRLLGKRFSSSPRHPGWCWGPHKLPSKAYWSCPRELSGGYFNLTPT